MNRIPLPYAIPDEYVVQGVPEKTRIFSDIVPGVTNYRFGPGEQDLYYKQYQTSRFAITQKKGGWDCLRHYEILMNGCIPIFNGLEACPKTTMVTFPKTLVLSAMKDLLPWEETSERIELYNTYVLKLLDHVRKFCTTSALALRFSSYMPPLLTSGSHDPSKKILMIQGWALVNYSREFLSIGLRRLYGSNFTEYPKNDALYDTADPKGLYGNGFTYSGRLDSAVEINRESLEERIKKHEFDSIVYGNVGAHEGAQGTYTTMPFFQLVQSVYTPNEIAFLYGGDACQSVIHHWQAPMLHLENHEKLARCFIRELEDPELPEYLWKL